MTDRNISFCSMLAWLLSSLAFVALFLSVGFRVGEHDDAAFIGACGFICLATMSGVAHVRSYFCVQNRLLRQIIAGQRAAEHDGLHCV